MTAPRIKLAALVAGGKSRRMGQDKALLGWKGTPLWRHQWKILCALNPERVVVVAPQPPSWLPSAVQWIKDHDEAGPISPIRPIGPIGGVLSALETVGEGLVVALAVDLPSMTSDYLARLQAVCTETTGAVPHTSGGFEPLAAIYPAGAAASAREWIGSGHHDFQGWIAQLVEQGMARQVEVGPEEMQLFRNLNTPEDLGNR